jgi:putative ABC transport system permease protein
MATTTAAAPATGRRHSALLAEVYECASFAIDSFRQNKTRFSLTALCMVIGTASLILVVTIGLSGKQYILRQIQGIGANMVVIDYKVSAGRASNTQQDFLTIRDMRAVQEQVPGVTAASPLIRMTERIPIGGGKEGDAQILGVSPDHRLVRNLEILAGRFIDSDDLASRAHAAVVTQEMANKLWGSPDAAVGQTLRLSNLPFTIIGTFRESVETFGQSEIVQNTILIPYTVAQSFTGTEYVRQLYFSMADPELVPTGSEQIRKVIESRHRPESVYEATNLTQVLAVAARTANALTMVLLLIATVTIIVSGVGIMNIMLVTVKSRTREIGIRKAVGATSREIRFQFLAEAMFISLAGGFIGIVIGMALPISVRIFTPYRLPISGVSVIVAVLVSSVIGIVFGTVPASRAAQLDPVESLRYE